MARVEVRNLNNEVVEKLDLADEVFAYSASRTLVWEAVRAFRSAQRKGTHSTKVRSQVRGGGRKPWRQKGTGRARAGTIRSPLWRSGGTVFGPTPRDHTLGFPKKKRRGAIKMVLSDKLQNQKIIVIDDMQLETHRTREFLGVLDAFNLERKVLIVDHRENRNLYLSSRNLPRIKMTWAQGVNVYDLLDCDHLLISKRALLELQEALKK